MTYYQRTLTKAIHRGVTLFDGEVDEGLKEDMGDSPGRRSKKTEA